MEQFDHLRVAGLEPKVIAGLQLLTVDQVHRLLLTAEREGWIIWGLDGFEVVDGGVRPDMDQIADWSALKGLSGDQLGLRSVEETRRFLATTARDDRLYEVAISEEVYSKPSP
ncbi:hypothetical protein ACFODL_06675 [Phenylobacterium terrae]|uniref:Uncharacterized protein n=1 Tax=Phenylobacterium terrae TaxID=2665495 RepID=A0ABW4N630_9CAUL